MNYSRLVAASLLAAGMLAVPSLANAREPKDPLEGYYGNTLVCAGGEKGQDLCHTWIERDGTFINIDPSGIHRGHYTRGPKRADGKTPVCYHNDNSSMVLPAELMGPPPGSAPPPPMPVDGGLLCKTTGFKTTCAIHQSSAGFSADDRKRFKYTIAERFHEGMCYPLQEKKPGDSWYEEDDPMPSGNGLDKLFLLKGHR